MSDLDADAIRQARETAGWSIAEAAHQLRQLSTEPLPGLPSIIRSWKRWEAGTTPSRLYERLLRRLLGLDQTNGNDRSQTTSKDLAGEWWAAWQTTRNGEDRVAIQPVQLSQHSDRIYWRAARRGLTADDGGYLWAGELQLWDRHILMGHYVADGEIRSKGTVYFVLHPHGHQATGRWVGLAWDGDTETGLGALARTEHQVEAVMTDQLRRLEARA
jgi:hypothetical protein